MNEPKLQPPGAGLPFFENLLIRYVVLPRTKRKMSWDNAGEMLERETKRTLNLCKNLPSDLLAKKVLIPRIRGIEDSSRYWSIDMTLEHMIIVANGMTRIIESLAREQVFTQKVNTAEVKPKDGPHGDMPAQFAMEMADIIKKLQQISNRNSKATHPHPWFGARNTADWHLIIAMHQRLHRYQIEQIIAGLHR